MAKPKKNEKKLTELLLKIKSLVVGLRESFQNLVDRWLLYNDLKEQFEKIVKFVEKEKIYFYNAMDSIKNCLEVKNHDNISKEMILILENILNIISPDMDEIALRMVTDKMIIAGWMPWAQPVKFGFDKPKPEPKNVYFPWEYDPDKYKKKKKSMENFFVD